MIQKIAKRDGRLVPFDPTKIERAIRKAGLETGEYEPAEAARLSRITQDRLPHDKAPGVELIQDTVERTLIDEGYVDTARAYIAYRERRAQARRDLENSVDVNKSINEYIGRSDWRVNANANQGYNLGGLILNASGKMMANYWLGHIYPKAVGEAHRNGDIHIHDLDILGGYCFTGDTRVWTPDGKNPTFKELVDNGVDQLWVYAYNRVKHKAARAIAIKPRVTRHVDELVEVTLMTGELIRCTPDHQIMTYDGEYKRARELKVGNALMPFDHVDNTAEPIVRECNTVKLDEPIPVYDLTVPGYSNFALYGPNVFVHNCAGWSLRTLLREGFNGVANKIESAPPKHLSSALGQMVNFLGTLQNEWAGAQAFSSADTYLAPYIRVDNLTQDEVEQCMQNFVFSMNVPSRWGGQCPFTNLTFDLVCPDDLRNVHPEVGGTVQDFTYGELQHEMDMVNRAFVRVMCAGDLHGRVFTFPIPTYNITDDFDWDSPITDEIFEMTAKYGLPYFQNFLKSDMDPHMVRSMCCRLRLDVSELLKRGNGLFGSAEQTGSIGVVTVNMARLGYEHAGDKKALYEQLDYLLNLAKVSLELKRKTVTELMERGLYPFTARYLGTFRNHFSTIGVNGINELIRNYTHDEHDITDDVGHKMAAELLDHIREKMVEFQTETGHMYNLEATPGEGACYRFAREDIKRHPDIIHAGTDERPYYTNSSQLPVNFTSDPFLALEMQQDLQAKYTGGTVLHLYLGERVSSAKAAKALVHKSLANFAEPYITLTPTFSVCPRHGYIAGEHKWCPKCDEELKAAHSHK